MQKAAQAYFSTKINTTTKGDILLMLYEGAVKFLNQAKERMQARDYAQKGILISKALDVIAELDGSLNPEKGGELAQNLHKLYFYCNARLLRANLEMNEEFLNEVIRILEALRNAFVEINAAEGPAGPGRAKAMAEAMDAAAQASAAPEAAQKALPDAPGAQPPLAMPQAYQAPARTRTAAPEAAPKALPDEPQARQGPGQPIQEIRNPANLRMVAKLKAYHKAST